MEFHRMSLAQNLVGQVVGTYDYLQALPEKSPQPGLNACLSALVESVRPEYAPSIVKDVLSDKKFRSIVPGLRGQLSECEFELEKHWAGKIVSGQNAYEDYPYISNYRALIDAEARAVKTLRKDPLRHISFIGSGPVPLTAFEMAKMFSETHISCVERDRDAFVLGQEVARASHIGTQHIFSDAAEIDFSEQDVIFVASMVENKKDVLARIAQSARKNTLVGVRSVEGLRHTLYTPVAPADIPDGFHYAGKTQYRPEHINTTLFYRVA